MAMHTLAAHVRPAKIKRTYTPANDTNPCWTADRRAALLLASCAAVPPAAVEHRGRYGNSVDRWLAYVGYRAEALEAIRMEIGDRLMMHYQEHGDAAYEPFRLWCEQPDTTAAIFAAINASVEG